MTIDDLGVRTGLGRQVIGRIVRGETRRIDPEQAALLVRELPITMGPLLVACGYALSLTPADHLPRALAAAWTKLPKKTQDGMLELIEAAASQIDPAAGTGAE